jgi:hypothetical protein
LAPLLENRRKEALFFALVFNSLDLVTLLFCVQVNRYTSNLALRETKQITQTLQTKTTTKKGGGKIFLCVMNW